MTTENPPKPHFQPIWALQVTLKRLRHQWRNFLTMVVGVLLASIIGASIPLYTAAVGQVGLQQTLANADRADVHLALRTGIAGLSPAGAELLDNETREMLSSNLARWTQETVRWEETLPLPPERDDNVIEATRLRLGHYQGWQNRVTVEEGQLPDQSPPTGVDAMAVASLDLAQALQLNVGDRLVLRDGRESSTPIRVLITGLVKASDPSDPFWPQDAPPLLPAEPVGQWQVQGTLLVLEETLFSLLDSHLPETTSNLGWRVLMDHPSITLAEIPTIGQAMAQVNDELDQLGASYFSVETDLPSLLETYAAQADLLGAPFGLLIIQIGALTIYFLLMTAELIRHNERREISLMRSRGGFGTQVWALRALEAMIICLAMVVIAPFAARAGLRQFGNLGPLQGLDIGMLPLELTPEVFAYAIGAGLVSWATLMFTLRPVMRAPLISAGGTWERPEKMAWWQRYYIDIGFLILGGIAYWQLSSYGSLLIQQIPGVSGNGQDGLIIDPLLLLTPSLLMIAVGALALRLFSPLMNLFSQIMARRDGLTAQLSGWQISRRPVHYSRIALMLALAIGMGWFATTFSATVTRSQSDRARYAAGADLRFTELDTELGTPRTRPAEFYRQIQGVKQASTAFRSRINASTRPGNSVFGELLGVDPATFGLTTNWRPDLGVLMVPGSNQSPPEPAGRLLAPTPFRLGFWIYSPNIAPSVMVNRLAVGIKVQDDDGTLVNVPLKLTVIQREFVSQVPDLPTEKGPIYLPTGWIYAEADLTKAKRTLVAPLRLHSIHWTHRASSRFGEASQIALADLVLYDRWGTPTRLDWLDSLVGWRYLDDGGSNSEGSIYSTGKSPLGNPRLGVTWTQDGRTSSMGLVLDDSPSGSLPAIVSKSFLAANGLSGSEPFTLNVLDTQLLFRVVAIMDNYPSLYANERPYVVTDVARLVDALNYRPSATYFPNEVWLKLDSPDLTGTVLMEADRNDGGFAVKYEWSAVELQRRMQNNPLTIGLTGLFFIAFGVALILSAIGLLSYVALTAQARRVEFSILQSLGLAPRRLLMSLALEQGIVLLSGVLVGAALGALLSQQILPFLSVTEMGQVITPPFIVETGIELLLQYTLIMLAIFATLLLASLWLLRRLPLARTLRLGDE